MIEVYYEIFLFHFCEFDFILSRGNAYLLAFLYMNLVPPFLNLVSNFYRISHVSIKPTQTPLQGKKKVAIIIDIIVVESELMLTVLEVYPC